MLILSMRQFLTLFSIFMGETFAREEAWKWWNIETKVRNRCGADGGTLYGAEQVGMLLIKY